MGKLYKPIQGDGAVEKGEQLLHDYLVAKLPDDYYMENPERTDPVRQVLIDPLKLF